MTPDPITCDELINTHRQFNSHTFDLFAWAELWPAYTDWLWDPAPCPHDGCVRCADRPGLGPWQAT